MTSTNADKKGRRIWVKIVISVIVLMILAGAGASVLYYQKTKQMNLTLAQIVPGYIPAYLKTQALSQSIEQYLNHPFWAMNENQEMIKKIKYIYDSAEELMKKMFIDRNDQAFFDQSFDIAVTGIDYSNMNASFIAAVDIGQRNAVLAEWFPGRFYQKVNENFDNKVTKLEKSGKIFWHLDVKDVGFPVYYCCYKNLFLISLDLENLEQAVANEILKENQLAENRTFQKFNQELSSGKNFAFYLQAERIYNDLLNHNILDKDSGLIGRVSGLGRMEALCLTSRVGAGIPVENLYLMIPEKTGLVRILNRHAGIDYSAPLIPKQSAGSVSFSIENSAEMIWNILDLADQIKNIVGFMLPLNIPEIRDGIRTIQAFVEINIEETINTLLNGGVTVFTDEFTNIDTDPRFGVIKHCPDPLALDKMVKTLKDFGRSKLGMNFIQVDDYKGDPIYRINSEEEDLEKMNLHFITKGNYFLLATAPDMLSSMMGKLEKLPEKEKTEKKKDFLTFHLRADRYITFVKSRKDQKVRKKMMPAQLDEILVPEDLAHVKFSMAADEDGFHLHSSPGVILPYLLTHLTSRALSDYYSGPKVVFNGPRTETIQLKPMFSRNLKIDYQAKVPGTARITIDTSKPVQFDLIPYSSKTVKTGANREKRDSAEYRYYIEMSEEQSIPLQKLIFQSELAGTEPVECTIKIEHLDEKPVTAGTLWLEPETGMMFVRVPSGCFKMGSNSGESEEKPVHDVCLDGFWMAAHEVTNQQFRQFRSDHNSKDIRGVNLNGDHQPAVYVSWNDAKQFIKWLNTRTKRKFHLPSEAQWEYAARAGTVTSRFWGDNPDDACLYANVYDKTSKAKLKELDRVHHNCNDGFSVAAPVGSFIPNSFGLYDMLGNVWEWCEDVGDYKAHSKHDRNNPLVTIGGGEGRVLRGGCWVSYPSYVRAARRYWFPADYRKCNVGFRLCLPQVRQ